MPRSRRSGSTARSRTRPCGAPAKAESPLLRLLADVGAIVALATATLYYFGWVRTKEQARVLGFDASAMSLGTTDYILKSLNVLFVPIVVLVLAALALYVTHLRVVEPRLAQARGRAVPQVARLLGWAWLPLVAAALVATTAQHAPGVLTAGSVTRLGRRR